MDAPVTVPPVVAVLVTWEPGPWLEETLAALAAQDYPNLSVLVLDAASTTDPTARVAAELPGAFVRRLEANPGYAAAANEVLTVVEGASHFLFCHDDAAPDPDAVRLLVEEAFRSNAGIVAPKIVDWEAPDRLLQVGMSADKTGSAVALVERGELDQEQHDGVRDVFVAPSPCLLVRADLFASLGGFDPEMTVQGEDVDLSWRAQVAGARVIVAPAARVRHFEALGRGLRVPPEAPSAAEATALLHRLEQRHAVRSMLKCYGPWHLLRVMPQAVAVAIGQMVVAFATRRPATARDVARAWTWNLARRGELRQARRDVQRHRVLGDAEVRRLQVRGSAPVTSFARGHHLVGEDSAEARLVAAAGRRLAIALRPGAAGTAALVAAAVLLVGSRGLVGDHLAAVGQFAPFPSPGGLLRQFASGWRLAGLGSEGPAAPGLGAIGLLGVLLGGAMGLLQQILVLGTIPLGAVGIFRLVRPLRSGRAQAAALIMYLAVPLPYNAVAGGRWSGLVAYALAPWVVGRILQAAGREPFAGPARRRRDEILSLGLPLGAAAVIAPGVVVAMLWGGTFLVLGLWLVDLLSPSSSSGRPGERAGSRSDLRAVLVLWAGGALAAALLLPWALDLLRVLWPHPGPLALAPVVRFQTGPMGAGPFGWAFLAAAALPLAVGRGWRAGLGGALWLTAIGSWVGAWLLGRGWLPLPVADLETLLAPAAVAMALATALGARAFESDLSDYHFGWRQLLSGLAAVGVVLATLPVLGAAVDGRWHQPRRDIPGLLSWLGDRADDGPFRVVWIGHPDVLPLAGWRLGDGVAYGTSRSAPADVTGNWPGRPAGGTRVLSDALHAAADGGTTELGHLMGPMAVRYVVLVQAAAPGGDAAVRTLPPRLVRTMATQVDLRRVESDPAVVVYENAAWAPLRAGLGPDAATAAGGRGLRSAARAELAGSPVVLPGRSGPFGIRGRVAPGPLLLSETASPRWRLAVDGRTSVRRRAFGWANLFEPERAGRGVLRFHTSPLHWAAHVLQVALWAVLASLAARNWLDRRRRASPGARPVPDRERRMGRP
ncbi:MAG TPA: glycosyltransferase [Acidimicrobiales bacterium]|nr:glycosyltransferase [Acidimicrobiales bacterium]